ncbi:MAG: glycerate kinase [Clostridia bacterium]
MKIVIAPDSFKGSLEALEICEIVEKSAKKIFPNCLTIKLPMADGGEGTTDCLIGALSAEKVFCKVLDPLGREITAYYAKFGDSAVMEMAQASGITLVKESERDIFSQSTFGTGQMILHAIKNGAKNIFIGIGGSATNDGGIGFASALGVNFFDKNNSELNPIAKNFSNIESIDLSNINPKILETNITIMSDVSNPLLGKTGATYVFGSQKGATEKTLPILEAGMTDYIEKVEKFTGRKVRDIKGAGAAGGLGSALLAFTNAKMQSGVSTILDILKFEEHLQTADLVITGEGMMDYQSAFGKVASGVGNLCKKHSIPCIAIVGGMGEKAEEMFEHGITSIIPTVNGIMSLDMAIKNAKNLCESASDRMFRMISALKP